MAACGTVKPEDSSGAAGTGGVAGTGGAGGRVHVTISGVAAPHPLDKALTGTDQDFSMLKVSIVDPSAVILDPNAPPLGSMALDTSAANCPAGCAWTLPGVDITNQNLGLVGTLEDTRTGDARVWVKTGTGLATKADLDAVRAAPAPAAIMGRHAFAVSRALEVKLGALVGAALGKTFGPGALEAQGFLIGHVVAQLSTGPTPAGVAGAKVVPTGMFDVVYPTADFSGAGTTTSTSGIFIAVPKTADAMVATWDVVKPAGDPRSWAPHLAGSNPNNAFVIILPASELPD